MKRKLIWIALIVLLFTACDDNTGSLGTNIMPDEDNIGTLAGSYEATSKTILAENIYARTGTAYLGKYTDVDFGTFEADFLTQFNSSEEYLSDVDEEQFVNKADIAARFLFIYPKTNFFGDSLATFRLNVYELTELIEDDPTVYYYTDIDPTDYYDVNSEPIAQKVYTVSDSIYPIDTNSYMLDIPVSNNLGEKIINLHQTNPEYFENSEVFKENVFKGVYVTCDHGDGAILYIDKIVMLISADLYYKDSVDVIHTDSILHNRAIAEFTATQEIVQANRFKNSDVLREWANEETHTYLKTPAGLFTEVTLPLEEDGILLSTDSLNLASITFKNYNTVSNEDKIFQMDPPEYLLMVRKKDMESFFVKNQVPDNNTSYLVKHDTSNNEYVFNNIARLAKTCLLEKKNGTADEDWNKVVLIPVTPTTDSNGNIVTIRHDLKLTSAKLVGGIEGEKIKMSTIHTTFK